MSFRLGSPRLWLLTLAAILAFSGTFSLGQWQLRRAAQKESVQAAIDSRSDLPALDGRALSALDLTDSDLHRRVVVKGVWQTSHTIYLDNRPMSGRTGFWVVTPLALQGSDKLILVQRGWVPRDFTDRTRLPKVATPDGVVTVEGRIAPPPSKLYAFKGMDTGLIRQNLDIDAFRLETGLPLLNASLLQIDAPSDGLLREWPAPGLGVAKHYGYAFQWFSLSVLVLGLYVWFQLLPPLRRRYRRQSSAQERD